MDLRNSIERWFFQETFRKNSNIQVNRSNSNKRMKTTTDIQNLLCEKDFLLLVNEVSKKSLENVIIDISGMFPQSFDLNSQLRPYEFSKRSCINVTAMSATGRQSSVNNMKMFQQCEKCDVCGNNIDSEFCTFCSPSANEVEMLEVELLVDGVDEVDDGCATESEIDDDLRQYSNILQSLDEANEIISNLGELGMLLENNDYDQG